MTGRQEENLVLFLPSSLSWQ